VNENQVPISSILDKSGSALSAVVAWATLAKSARSDKQPAAGKLNGWGFGKHRK